MLEKEGEEGQWGWEWRRRGGIGEGWGGGRRDSKVGEGKREGVEAVGEEREWSVGEGGRSETQMGYRSWGGNDKTDSEDYGGMCGEGGGEELRRGAEGGWGSCGQLYNCT